MDTSMGIDLKKINSFLRYFGSFLEKIKAFILKEFGAFILKGRGSPCDQVKV